MKVHIKLCTLSNFYCLQMLFYCALDAVLYIKRYSVGISIIIPCPTSIKFNKNVGHATFYW